MIDKTTRRSTSHAGELTSYDAGRYQATSESLHSVTQMEAACDDIKPYLRG
jgi:hypothetical protein